MSYAFNPNISSDNWKGEVQELYDPTGGLPTPGAVGEQYIASATANGWTENYIYQWDGAVWVEIVPAGGDQVLNDDSGTVLIFGGAGWEDFGTAVNHSSLAGLANDDHPQYHDDTRADLLYFRQPVLYQKPEVDQVAFEERSTVTCGVGQDYETFKSAVDALNAKGGGTIYLTDASMAFGDDDLNLSQIILASTVPNAVAPPYLLMNGNGHVVGSVCRLVSVRLVLAGDAGANAYIFADDAAKVVFLNELSIVGGDTFVAGNAGQSIFQQDGQGHTHIVALNNISILDPLLAQDATRTLIPAGTSKLELFAWNHSAVGGNLTDLNNYYYEPSVAFINGPPDIGKAGNTADKVRYDASNSVADKLDALEDGKIDEVSGADGEIPLFTAAGQLVSSGETPADFADASHTHPASEVTDFDTEVENNTEVTANTTHRGLTNNPHSVTKTQVSLGNVTDDAQLKRAANDFSSFDQKDDPDESDLLLIEDQDDSGAKKYVAIEDLPMGWHLEDASEGESQTSSNTWQQKLRLSTGAIPAGRYRIGWYFETDVNNTQTDVTEARVQVDDTDTLASIENAAHFDSTSSMKGDWHPCGGFAYVDLDEDSHDIDIDYRANTSPNVIAYIRRARLEIHRVTVEAAGVPT